MKKSKYIIIDDQPYAIAGLKDDIESVFGEELEFIGSAEGVISGVKLIKKQSPDIIFLDIEMGDGNAFDVLDMLDEVREKIILVTGSKEYAIKAFRYNAVDYLLKPVDHEDLRQAVGKILKKDKNNLDADVQDKLSLSTSDEIKIVKIEDIVRLESEGNYTHFYFVDGSKLLITKTLKEFVVQLKGHHFIRVHQSHLVNINQIDSYQKNDGGYLLMKDKSIVSVSVRKKAYLMDMLSNL